MGRPRKAKSEETVQDFVKKRKHNSVDHSPAAGPSGTVTSKSCQSSRIKVKRKSPDIKPHVEESKRQTRRNIRVKKASPKKTSPLKQSTNEEKFKIKVEVHRPDSLTPIPKKKRRKGHGDSVSKSEMSARPSSPPKKMKVSSGIVQTGGGPALGHKFIGAHVSIAGGLYKAVHEAVDIGARAFGMFLKSQRQWKAKPMEDKQADKFKEACQEYKYAPHMIVPHGSYLLNLGSPNPENLQKSRDSFIDELQRCERLGLAIYNFHPGSTCGDCTRDECIARIATSINMAHQKTKYVIAVIENMCCQGGTVGGKFSDLAAIIKQVKDKARVGVCMDTCHAFAAGYDLSTDEGYKQAMDEFEHVVGFKYLKAVHINDSKGVCGCHLDRHENIGKGKLGLKTFTRIMNDPRFNNIPFVLETPGGKYDYEVKKLYSLLKK